MFLLSFFVVRFDVVFHPVYVLLIQPFAPVFVHFNIMLVAAFVAAGAVGKVVNPFLVMLIPDFAFRMFVTAIAGINAEVIIGVTGVAGGIMVPVKLKIF